MNKLKLHTPDLTAANIDRIAALFPNCVTETKDESGKPKRAIDFDLLRQELSESLVEGPQERYRLDWPGKREALALANQPITKTLRPCREESVDFENTKNLYIEGDNLDALKLLQETYLGKVKMIYIDPPYNTGNDFIYDDNFSMNRSEYEELSGDRDEEGNAMFDAEKWKQNSSANGRFHSEWLSMMYPRLKLARNLLTDDGVLFVHIDDNEVETLGKICSEIFGEENFINIITIKTKIGGVSGSSEGKSLKDSTEFIWGFSKNKENTLLNSVYIKTKLSDRIRSYELEGKSWKYTSIITKLDDKVLIKEDKERGARYFGYKTLETMSIQSFARANNLTEEEVYNQHAEKIFRTTNAQSSVRQTVIKETAGFDYPMYGCEYSPIKGRNEGSIIEVLYKAGSTDDQRNMVMFLSDVVQKIDGIYYYMDKVGSLWEDIDYNNLTKEGDVEFASGKKPIKLIQRLLSLATNKDSLVFDFFSGSGSTAHAVMQLNAEDGGKRRHIMVQLPEPCDEKSDAFKVGYKTIAEIGKERIRRAGQKILREWQAKQAKEQSVERDLLHPTSNIQNSTSPPDIGFRVLKIADSNFREIERTPEELDQKELALHTEHIKPDRTPEDLLFQVLVDWGVDLALPIVAETLHGKRVFFVDENALAACFDTGLSDELVHAIATRKPLRAVFRDDGFGDDSTRINVEQIFKLLSPATEVKAL